MTTANATGIADLLDALKEWLAANPEGDLDEFAAENGVTLDDISDSWNTYFSADFSRDYNIDNVQGNGGAPSYTPQPPPAGNPGAMKEYILQEVHNHQTFNTVNNIEDNSFNQQIVAGGDVHQDIELDNSETTVGDNGVVIDDSTLTDSNVVTGDDNVVDSEDVLDGDVTTTAGDGGQAQSGINFGEGDLQQNQQDQDVDVVESGDNTGGAGGDGGAGGGGFDRPLPVEEDGGNGGIYEAEVEPYEPEFGGGSGGGAGGDGGNAGDHLDVDVNQNAPDFG